MNHTDVVHEFGGLREVSIATTQLRIEAGNLVLGAHVLGQVLSVPELHATAFEFSQGKSYEKGTGFLLGITTQSVSRTEQRVLRRCPGGFVPPQFLGRVLLGDKLRGSTCRLFDTHVLRLVGDIRNSTATRRVLPAWDQG